MLAQASNEFFGHSSGRIEFEKVWTTTLYDELTVLLWKVPVNWRYFIKHRLFDAVAAMEKKDVSPQDLRSVFEDLLIEHPQLRERVEAVVN